MQPLNQDKSKINVDARYRILLILWFAMLVAVSVFFMLTLLIPRPVTAENKLLSIILGAVGGFLAALSFVPKRKMLAQAVEKQEVRFVTTGYVIAFALSETVSIFGLLMYMLMPGRDYYVLFIVSVIFMFLHFPRREHLMAAMFKNQRGAEF